MPATRQRLGRGERAPDFVLPSQDGVATRLYAKAGGRPAVLLFYPTGEVAQLQQFADHLTLVSAGAVALFAVRSEDTTLTSQVSAGREDLLPIFADTQGKVRAAYRLESTDATILFVLDSNLRVLASLSLQDAAGTARQVMALLPATLHQVHSLEMTSPAPVLLIPNVLDPESCQGLIQVWETQGNVATGVERSHQNQREDTISPEIKRRRDHVVMDKELLQDLASTIGRRVLPEVYKAFVFRATRFEGFKIACYDAATGGFFHAHRDNLSPATGHRRFALSLNLNTGYEGGRLRFPEYGSHVYPLDAGSALVFSCSHLHEVTEVTQGRRFALLSFLFGEGDVRRSRAPSNDGSSPHRQ